MSQVYENSNFLVFDNGSGELIVRMKDNDVAMRVTAQNNKIEVTAAGNRISPFSVNGLPSFRISE
jgi:hypothetical protein